jgi:rod shape-determining protein MreC
VTADGLAGRVIESGADASRVLLLTDAGSRIPVFAGTAQSRAVMAGNNGPTARLDHVAGDVALASGDEVQTSGVGGLFPRGIRVGRIERDDRGLCVVPHARLDDLDYVQVLLFESPLLELVGGPDKTAADAGKLAPRAAEPRREQR